MVVAVLKKAVGRYWVLQMGYCAVKHYRKDACPWLQSVQHEVVDWSIAEQVHYPDWGFLWTTKISCPKAVLYFDFFELLNCADLSLTPRCKMRELGPTEVNVVARTIAWVFLIQVQYHILIVAICPLWLVCIEWMGKWGTRKRMMACSWQKTPTATRRTTKTTSTYVIPHINLFPPPISMLYSTTDCAIEHWSASVYLKTCPR